MIVRMKYTKEDSAIFLSHLDMVRLFERSFRRAEIPMAFTQGFNPHPIMSFAAPLSLGNSSIAEYVDIHLAVEVDLEEFLQRMRHILPKGIRVLKAAIMKEEKPASLMKEAAVMMYQVIVTSKEALNPVKERERLTAFLEQESIIIDKKTKEKTRRQFQANRVKTKKVDILPLIRSLDIIDIHDNQIIFKIAVNVLNSGTVKPAIVLQKWFSFVNLSSDYSIKSICRTEIFRWKNDRLEPILQSNNLSGNLGEAGK